MNDTIIDLGSAPLSNAYLRPEKLSDMEPFYPLKVLFCRECGLVQLEEFASPSDIFSEYSYFSSYSESWLSHAEKYAASMMADYGIGPKSQVVEVASNDGYLLQYFAQCGVPVLGIEPAANVAQAALEKGIPTKNLFFGLQTASELKREGYAADLIVANNVLAHVPDINGFVSGFKELLKPTGYLTVEFPHLLNLIEQAQFDTIYHEHFSYLSLLTVSRVFAKHGLKIFDVQTLSTHGGSLRVFASPLELNRKESPRVQEVLERERSQFLDKVEGYYRFSAKVEDIKLSLMEFLIKSRREGKRVLGYGAAAKGNTLLNYCGIRPDLLPAVADKNPYKQGKYLPGSRIPVISPEALIEERPDYILILPWNLKEEIFDQLSIIASWRGQFVTAVPELQVWYDF